MISEELFRTDKYIRFVCNNRNRYYFQRLISNVSHYRGFKII